MATVSELVAKAGGLIQAGRRAEARALLLNGGPACVNDPAVNELLGWMAAQERNWDEAAARYGVVADGRPEDLTAKLSHAKCLLQAGQSERARERAQSVWKAGGPVESLKVMGQALVRLREPAAAVDALHQYLKSATPDVDVVTGLAHALQYSGHADEAVELLRPWFERPDAGEGVLGAFAAAVNCSCSSGIAEVLRAHRRYGERIERAASALPRPVHTFKREGRHAIPRPLRVGLLSADFRHHSVSFFLEPIMSATSRERVEYCCYFTGKSEDELTARYEQAATVFRRVSALSLLDLAKQISADKVHILIDLSGHTQHNRLPVFELRPAPVQVTYLGYPVTTGLASIDYRIVDSNTDPVGTEAGAVERPLRLDPCMLTYRATGAAPEPRVRPEGPLVFACFGSAAKLNTRMFELYARVLDAVPGSRLVFRHWSLAEARLRAVLHQRMVQAGVQDPSRVAVEAPAASVGDVMLHYQDVDISLDTYPYNGTTTICESLWMGVPVVSKVGDRTASRMGLTLLKAVGLQDLAAASDDEFVRAAATLGADARRRAELRGSLRRAVTQTLGESAAFARQFESSMEMIWEKWQTRE